MNVTRLILYSVAWPIYIFPLFLMFHLLGWFNDVGHIGPIHRELELAAIVVWHLGFYGSLWLYCWKLKDYEI